jgi:hypothetical protein
LFSNLWLGDVYDTTHHWTLCSGCGPSHFQRSGCGFDFVPATATGSAAAGKAAAAADHILCAVDLAMTHFDGPDELDVCVGGEPDGIRQPGEQCLDSQLDRMHASGAMQAFPNSSLVRVASVTYPLLRAGVQHWVVAFPDSQTHAGWHLNSIGDPGLNAFFYGSCSGSEATCSSNLSCPAGETCEPQRSMPTISEATASSPRGAFRVWAGPPCAILAQPMLRIAKLNTPAGDDTLTVQGSVTLPVPFEPQLDPLTHGVRLLLAGTRGMLINTTVPGGAFSTVTNKGWKVNKAGTVWTYSDRSATPVDGIFKITIQDRSAKTAGLVTLKAKGKAGSYAVSQSDLPVTSAVVLGPPVEQCASATFAGPAPAPSCSFNKSGSTLKCK